MTNDKNTPTATCPCQEMQQQVTTCRMSCYVCGSDEWCGTDGCPYDPQ